MPDGAVHIPHPHVCCYDMPATERQVTQPLTTPPSIYTSTSTYRSTSTPTHLHHTHVNSHSHSHSHSHRYSRVLHVQPHPHPHLLQFQLRLVVPIHTNMNASFARRRKQRGELASHHTNPKHQIEWFNNVNEILCFVTHVRTNMSNAGLHAKNKQILLLQAGFELAVCWNFQKFSLNKLWVSFVV